MGFIGNGTWWNASLFLTGDTFGKGPLIASGRRLMPAARKPFSAAPPSGPGMTKRPISTSIWVANYTYVVHPAGSDAAPANPGVTTYPITFSDRPELRVDNVTFINTGGINAKNAYAGGIEAAASYGPFLLQGENFWYGIERNNPAAGVHRSHLLGLVCRRQLGVLRAPKATSYDPANGVVPPSEPRCAVRSARGQLGRVGNRRPLQRCRFRSQRYAYAIAADRVFGGKQYICKRRPELLSQRHSAASCSTTRA